ncbi:MAG: DUF2066 domain-containing protein [Alphaproteobacteria bacterium]|nr:DUF2066 domain-containing protein [Alphaproteobacteria bacterium]
MTLVNKTFTKALIVFAMVLCVWTTAADAQATNALFTVEDVKVDVTAENALKAREQAFEQAQLQAFQELTKRMLSSPQQTDYSNLPVQTISALVQDYEVKNEKLSAKRYIGTYTFRFRDTAVKRYFSQKGQQYTDVPSRPILILPFLETSSGMELWDNNPWMDAWASTPGLAGGLVPLVVPVGDLADVSDLGEDEALTYRQRNLYSLVERYGASEAVIAIAKPEGTGLNIQLYRTDRARPEYVHQIMARAVANQSESALYASGVAKVKEALRQDWKKKTVVDSTQSASTIQAHVSFASLQEWAAFQRNLNRARGVKNIQLKALSPRDAYIAIEYEGTLDRLRIALQQVDLLLEQPRVQNAASQNGLNADYSQGLLDGYYGNKDSANAVYELRSSRNARGGSRQNLIRPQSGETIQPQPASPGSNVPPSREYYKSQF